MNKAQMNSYTNQSTRGASEIDPWAASQLRTLRKLAYIKGSPIR
jgi:hypothetical protein